MEACSHCGVEVLVNRAISNLAILCLMIINLYSYVIIIIASSVDPIMVSSCLLKPRRAAGGGGSVKVTIDYYYSKSISTSFCFANRVSKIKSTLFVIQF